MAEAHDRTRTAGEAGWQISRYNISAPLPDSDKVVIVNLMRGTCHAFSQLELYLLSQIEELDERHPVIDPFARLGVIANHDERAELETRGRIECARAEEVGLVICPTMACNFDCPYCFENHGSGVMAPAVQDDVVVLAERMLVASGAKKLSVNWYGGEPLLAPSIIESLSQRLIDLAQRLGAEYEAGIITNGYLLTQDIADMLGRARVNAALISIDGIGPTHDATRRLAGGGPTFERITSNIRTLKLPFQVQIRHNMHEGNIDEKPLLEELVQQLRAESGNDIISYAAPVMRSDAADARGEQVSLLRGSAGLTASLDLNAERFGSGRGYFCGANALWGVGIDPAGNLQKCWEAVDKPHLSFGTAHDWDPADPLYTATHPDKLTCYLNTVGPVADEECRACVWLPHCVGGCPYNRLFGAGRICVPYKDNPQAFALAVHGIRNF